MNIHESAEDYLESILRLRNQKGYVRSVDIAAQLGVSKPSVSVAMKRLRQNGYILMDEENLISLTDKGYEIASKTYERHRVLTKALMSLGVPEDIAAQDACRVEHVISQETFDAVKAHVTDIEQQA